MPNGAVVWVEHVPRADRLIVQLFVSSHSLPADSKTNGQRHLLEHLTALGRNRDVDKNLETQGAFLTAQTLREATVYQLCLRPEDLSLALGTIRSIMQLGEISSEDIKKEAEVIRQEAVLEPAPQALSRVAWKAAFGSAGADPLGEPEEIAKTSPQNLAALHQQEFVAGNLTLMISGNIDLDGATAAATQVLGLVPSQSQSGQPARSFLGGGVSSAEVDGEAVACPVDSWNSPRTAARLAAALSIAAGIKNSFVTYTPSLFGSLIVVGHTGDSSGLDKLVGSLTTNGEFGIGRALAKEWVENQRSVQGNKILTGLLLSEGAGQRADTMLENLDQMTVEQFGAALNAFRTKDTIRVIGK